MIGHAHYLGQFFLNCLQNANLQYLQESITCCDVIVKWNVKALKPGTVSFIVHLSGQLRKEKSLWLAVSYQQGS